MYIYIHIPVMTENYARHDLETTKPGAEVPKSWIFV